MRTQLALFDTEIVTPPAYRQLSKDAVSECGDLINVLLQKSDPIEFFDTAKVRTDIDVPKTYEEYRLVVEQTEAIKNSRFKIIDYLQEQGVSVITVAEDGRPAFGGGRREPIGFSASTTAASDAARMQGRTAVGKIHHNMERLYAAGEMSTSQLGHARTALHLLDEVIQPAPKNPAAIEQVAAAAE